MIGCLVFHARQVPVENPQQRWIVTKIRELELVALPSLGLTNTRSDRLVSETRQEQHTVVTWQDGPLQTNSVATMDAGVEAFRFDTVTDDQFYGGTNVLLFDNLVLSTNLGWKLDRVPKERLLEELKRREEKK